ncbi:hypothetical protein DFH08DRAFT_997751 [Mycena albidolilacea]|uniref:Uncharacterized protein n=1 Tax=Mycena albidolilacea TaxID=1033008 RepID=A0AAD7E6D5_9AGAR|nr:hypothetical protein DFH08DRAFT_997751 [Mycena albidolilacea]
MRRPGTTKREQQDVGGRDSKKRCLRERIERERGDEGGREQENAIPPTMARKCDGRDINQSDSHVSLKDFTRKDFKRELVPPGQLPAAFIVLVAPANVGVGIAGPIPRRRAAHRVKLPCLLAASEAGEAQRERSRKGECPTGVSKDDPDDASEFLGVDLSALPNAGTDGLKATTEVLAEIVWETAGYRFLHFYIITIFTQAIIQFVNTKIQKTTAMRITALKMSRRHNSGSTKNPDVVKQCDKGQMDMFECGGWVTIWASSDESDCFIRISHLNCHQKYVCIDLLDDVKKFIAENPKLRAPQLWKDILKTHPRPRFSQKSVYNQWFKQQQTSWRRWNDEFESAKILLQEFASDTVHELVSIPMPESDGFCAIGFVFPSVLRKWDGIIRDVALDSTYEQGWL